MGLGHRPLFLLWTLVDKTLVARIVVWLMQIKAIKLNSLKEGNSRSPAALTQVGLTAAPHLSPLSNHCIHLLDSAMWQKFSMISRLDIKRSRWKTKCWPTDLHININRLSILILSIRLSSVILHQNFKVWTLLDIFQWDRVHCGWEFNHSVETEMNKPNSLSTEAG